MEQKNTQATLENLRSENELLKEKEKNFNISSNNTRNGEEIHGSPGCSSINNTGFESKLDMVNKIKKRLSLNDTGDYYARTMYPKVEKDPGVKELHSKRENLANALQKLYEGQVYRIQEKEHKIKKSKSKNKSHSKSNTKSTKQILMGSKSKKSFE